jgi:hypothetical protein
MLINDEALINRGRKFMAQGTHVPWYTMFETLSIAKGKHKFIPGAKHLARSRIGAEEMKFHAKRRQ